MALTHIWRTLLALVFMISSAWTSATAQPLLPVPELSARVMDATGTLTAAQVSAIESRLHGIETASGSQVVVLMVPSTGAEDIAPFANRVASSWKIGRKDVGDGLLIVIAKDDRRMRLEVARALEGAIPDLAASRIIEQHMAPHFRNNDYAGGVLAALDQVAARIAGEALPPPQAKSTKDESSIDLESWGIFLFIGIAAITQIIRIIFGRRWGAVVVSCTAGIAAWMFSSSLTVALIAAFFGFFMTLLGKSAGSGGGGGDSSSGGSSGGFDSFSSSDSFSSGGGGSFGGGGASGSW